MLSRIFSVSKAGIRLTGDRLHENRATEIEHKMANALIAEVNSKGFAVLPNFLNSEQCGELAVQLDVEFSKRSDKCWRDGQGSDTRLYGANLVAGKVNELMFLSPMLSRVVCGYMRWTGFAGYTMANRINYVENNVGSGGGWHRDSARYRDLKAIVYLTDVEPENGPFQYLPDSHKIGKKLKLIMRHGVEFANKRFHGQVGDILTNDPNVVELTGKAGTLILADTSGIHRGKPIASGCRHALTNYYWQNEASIHPRMLEVVPDFGVPKIKSFQLSEL